MGRILAIDYGKRRCGLAVTDPLRIVATALATVDTPKLQDYLKDYMSRETVDEIVVGLPTTMRGEPSDSMRYITPALGRLRKNLAGGAGGTVDYSPVISRYSSVPTSPQAFFPELTTRPEPRSTANMSMIASSEPSVERYRTKSSHRSFLEGRSYTSR